MMTNALRLMTCCIGLALTACSTGTPPPGALSLSLTDLGSEQQQDGGSVWSNLKHRRAYNITGLGAADAVGMLSTDPDPPVLLGDWFGPLRKRELLPDQLAMRINSTCSYALVQDYGDASEADVLAVRTTVQQWHRAVLKRVRDQLRASMLAALDNARAAVDALPPDTTTAQHQQAEQRRDGVASALAAVFGDAAPAPGDSTTTAIAAAQSAVLASAEAERLAYQELKSAQSKPGIVIANWQVAARQKRQLTVAGIAATRESDDQRAGYVVLGGLSKMTLVPGDDLMVRVCLSPGAKCEEPPMPNGEVWRHRKEWENMKRTGRTGIDSLFDPSRMYITTFQLLARHAAWTDSATERRLQQFSLQLDELAKQFATVKAASGLLASVQALKLSVSSAAESIAQADNNGLLSGKALRVVPFSFANDNVYATSVGAMLEAQAGRSAIISMRSSLDGHALSQASPFFFTQSKPRLPQSLDRCRRPSGWAEEVGLSLLSAYRCKVGGIGPEEPWPAMCKAIAEANGTIHAEACKVGRLGGDAPSAGHRCP